MLAAVASPASHAAPLSPALGDLVIAATAVLAAAFLRRRPFVALTVLLVLSMVSALAPSRWYAALPPMLPTVPVLLAAIAVCFIAATRSTRVSVIAAASTLAVLAASWAQWPTNATRQHPALFLDTPPELTITLITVIGWLIGHSIWQAHIHAESLRAQARSQQVIAARLQLARDLHDQVAHTIGVIAIQAGVASRVIDTQPDEARNSLSAIEATSRQTLAGLRQTVGALRHADGSSETDGSAFEPQPGLADLFQLAETTRKAGVDVDLRWSGERRPVPTQVDTCAFRIIQEALTNVVRHAGASSCRVAIDQHAGELAIQVTDDGRGGRVNGAGYGITGMRERATLLNGEFTAGPGPEGGFRVVARLPLVPAR
jgi:signal transduction histidine kinase